MNKLSELTENQVLDFDRGAIEKLAEAWLNTSEEVAAAHSYVIGRMFQQLANIQYDLQRVQDLLERGQGENFPHMMNVSSTFPQMLARTLPDVLPDVLKDLKRRRILEEG